MASSKSVICNCRIALVRQAFGLTIAALLLPWLTVAASSDIEALSGELESRIESHSNGRGLQAFQLPHNDDFDNIPQDPGNPLSREKVRLGKLLFHDTATGSRGTDPERTQTWSCASCHHVGAGFKAGVPQGIGEGGVGFGPGGVERRLAPGLDATAPAGDRLLPDVQPIASPTVLNSAWQDLMLWNGSFGNAAGGNNSLVAAVDGAGPPPIKANTFGLSGLETQVLAGTNVHRLQFDENSILQTNREYRFLYDRAFPDGNAGMIPDNGTVVTDFALGAAKAIAAYERTIISNLAPFQKWLAGDTHAMNEQQLRGALLFFGKAECVACHTGPALSSAIGAGEDEMFFALGFNDLDPASALVHGIVDEATRRGRGGFTGDPADDYKFKITPLYNLADSGVFGHGASFGSVREVVEYKNAAIAQNPDSVHNLSERFVPLGLTHTEIDDLVAFLEEGLYDQWLDRYVPNSVPGDSCFPVADMQSAIELGCLSVAGEPDVDQTPVCVSAGSDEDGDGWGWEQGASCRVVEGATQPPVVAVPVPNDRDVPACESTISDPDGDGWGWENERSCLVSAVVDSTSATVPVCESAASDPDGDGWGWENQRSCTVAGR